MSTHGVDELTVAYDARPARARAQRWRRLFRSRLISLGITVAALIALYAWQHHRLNANLGVLIGVYGLVLSLAVGWVVVNYAAYRITRRAAADVSHGVALRITRTGVELADNFSTWPQISALVVTKGRWPTGPRLALRPVTGDPVTVPLDQLDVRPATLDSTARVYSGGRHGVDLTALDA